MIIDDASLTNFDNILDIDDFITYIIPYYPNLKVSQFKIEEIEKALYNVFFTLIGKLIYISPINIRRFLKDYLLKYEIMNIKQIILGVIVGLTKEEKSNNVNFLIEKYLENTDFIEKLIEAPSLDRIQLLMKNTRYTKAIREGILYFKSYNEIFVLESFLDQLYYKNQISREVIYDKKERTMISLFNSIMTELYNINIIYRGIINNIDRNLLTQFLINKFVFFDYKKLEYLSSLEDLEEFFISIDNYLQNTRLDYTIALNQYEHPMWELNRIYINYFFKEFRIRSYDIEDLTLHKILGLIIKKEQELKLNIIPKVVDLLHKKYKKIEDIK